MAVSANKTPYNLLWLCAPAGAFALIPAIAVWIRYGFLVVPIICLILTIVALVARGRTRLSVLTALVVYGCLSWVVFGNYFEIREYVRWRVSSHSYQADVLWQKDSSKYLKHIEWDERKYPGGDAAPVYLVYDPDNLLSDASRSHASGKFPGLPCHVLKVQRLNDRWYSVFFFGMSDWNHCS